ncbi:hypothetical protein CBR_g40639 [Chara braunii]|uniref:Uncharacterized protein n=1 Tax=Chara braunii TaxID=69332 RepID=A0A388LU93_CHABU|nr:hypothetical protein CBR_g40639 [Chara braunii]|eukprot:GBG85829.1 hypothetical protein CBR_g40639 [Chara braunii]
MARRRLAKGKHFASMPVHFSFYGCGGNLGREKEAQRDWCFKVERWEANDCSGCNCCTTSRDPPACRSTQTCDLRAVTMFVTGTVPTAGTECRPLVSFNEAVVLMIKLRRSTGRWSGRDSRDCCSGRSGNQRVKHLSQSEQRLCLLGYWSCGLGLQRVDSKSQPESWTAKDVNGCSCPGMHHQPTDMITCGLSSLCLP